MNYSNQSSLASEPAVPFPLSTVIRPKITMMLLVVAVPGLRGVFERHRIRIHLASGNSEHIWQHAIHIQRVCGILLDHVRDRIPYGVKNLDTESIMVLARVRLLVLRHVDSAPAERVRVWCGMVRVRLILAIAVPIEALGCSTFQHSRNVAAVHKGSGGTGPKVLLLGEVLVVDLDDFVNGVVVDKGRVLDASPDATVIDVFVPGRDKVDGSGGLFGKDA